MGFYPVIYCLSVRVQCFGNLLCLHPLRQITDQNTFGLSGFFSLPALQPLEPGPLIFHPLGVHIVWCCTHNDQHLCRHQRRNNIWLIFLACRNVCPPGIEHTQTLPAEKIVQVRCDITIYCIMIVNLLFYTDKNIIPHLVFQQAVLIQNTVDFRQFCFVDRPLFLRKIPVQFFTKGHFIRVCQVGIQNNRDQIPLIILLIG